MDPAGWRGSAQLLLVLVLTVTAPSGSLLGQPRQLIIATTGDAETMDPMLTATNTTSSIQNHALEPLFDFDPDGRLRPVLAEGFKFIDNTTWEITLRRGVWFHNGEPFDAEAVKFNIERAKMHPRSLQKAYVSLVTEVQIVNDHTVRIKTSEPFPDLITNLESVELTAPGFSRQAGDEGLSKRAIGTGPFRFVEWVRDERIVFERNDNYWGPKPQAQRVVIRPIPEDATRVAALLSREVDIIEGVPIPDIGRVTRTRGFKVLSKPGARLIYLAFDTFREIGGKEPERSPGLPEGMVNPFRDRRVRQAFWFAVNTKEIVEQVMEGHAQPADQLIAPFMFGFNPMVRRPNYDPSRAKRLLAEAGFATGFKVILETPTDRYVNDEEAAQAVAGQLRRVGIEVEVRGWSQAIYFPRIMRQFQNSFHLSGWGTLISSIRYTALAGCVDPKKSGYGRANYGRWCSAEMDRLIHLANTEMDVEKRRQVFFLLAEMVRNEVPKIPLYHEELIRGVREGLEMPVRFDEHVRAQDVTFK